MKYFMVTCHRGHCGNRHSTEIKFAFQAENAVQAMDAAKRMPSVKHTRMILCTKEITRFEYEEYREISAYQRYFQSRNKKRR